MTASVRAHAGTGLLASLLVLVASWAALTSPPQARADTPLAAFCADNAVELSRTSHEMGLDPATWASDPKNLAKFGFQPAGDIDALYHAVIDAGAPSIRSHFSNETGRVEWRCSGQ